MHNIMMVAKPHLTGQYEEYPHINSAPYPPAASLCVHTLSPSQALPWLGGTAMGYTGTQDTVMGSCAINYCLFW